MDPKQLNFIGLIFVRKTKLITYVISICNLTYILLYKMLESKVNRYIILGHSPSQKN